jgi:hypothetical protein
MARRGDARRGEGGAADAQADVRDDAAGAASNAAAGVRAGMHPGAPQDAPLGEAQPPPPGEGPLFARADPSATAAQRIAAVHAFSLRCREWAVAAIARRQAEGRSAADWEVYLRFTDHTLAELENGTLDHWFAENS